MTTVDTRAADKDIFRLARWARNRFLWRYPTIALAYTAVSEVADYCFIHAGRGFFLTIMLSFGQLLLSAAFLLLAAVFLIKRRLKLASAVALAVFILASPFFDRWFGEAAELAIDQMRFRFLRKQYETAIAKIPAGERASTVVFFEWGSMGFAVTGTAHYWLVYDESGEIALPDAERTEAWKGKVYPKHGELIDKDCMTRAYRLSGHYYSMMTGCTY